jgi:predicted lipoprotein with Yx(FWY)xxD motif
MLVAAVAGFTVAAIAGIAIAKSFTLSVRKNVHVTDITGSPVVNKREAVAVGPAGFAVYTLAGETMKHLKCTSTTTGSMCLTFWPPVSVRSARNLSEQTGIKGKLGAFHRGKFGLQLTLGGKPVYYFLPDLQGKNKANAQGDLVQNSGTWHVITASADVVSKVPASPPPTVTTTPTTTTSPYPGY